MISRWFCFLTLALVWWVTSCLRRYWFWINFMIFSICAIVASNKWRRSLVKVFVLSSFLTVKSLRWSTSTALIPVVLLFFLPDRLVPLLVVVFPTLSFNYWLESSFLLVVALMLNSSFELRSDCFSSEALCFYRSRRWKWLFGLDLKSFSRPAPALKQVRVRVFWVALFVRRRSSWSWSPSELWFLLSVVVSICKTALIGRRVEV